MPLRPLLLAALLGASRLSGVEAQPEAQS